MIRGIGFGGGWMGAGLGGKLVLWADEVEDSGVLR